MLQLIDSAFSIITELLIPIALGLCVLYFLWGIFKYVRTSAGSEKSEGKSVMVWGVVGIFVAFSIWGILELLRGELGIQYIPDIERPSINGTTSTFNPISEEDDPPPYFSR